MIFFSDPLKWCHFFTLLEKILFIFLYVCPILINSSLNESSENAIKKTRKGLYLGIILFSQPSTSDEIFRPQTKYFLHLRDHVEIFAHLLWAYLPFNFHKLGISVNFRLWQRENKKQIRPKCHLLFFRPPQVMTHFHIFREISRYCPTTCDLNVILMSVQFS